MLSATVVVKNAVVVAISSVSFVSLLSGYASTAVVVTTLALLVDENSVEVVTPDTLDEKVGVSKAVVVAISSVSFVTLLVVVDVANLSKEALVEITTVVVNTSSVSFVSVVVALGSSVTLGAHAAGNVLMHESQPGAT